MATYSEIYSLVQDGALTSRTAVAVVVAADAIRANGTATVPEQQWATGALRDPLTQARMLLFLALVQNKAATLSQLQNASDTQLQTAVDSAVAMLVAAA